MRPEQQQPWPLRNEEGAGIFAVSLRMRHGSPRASVRRQAVKAEPPPELSFSNTLTYHL